MPRKLTGYRVFIASPAGLQDERRTFRNVLTSYNESDALARNVLFIPVGWEETLGGVGRPQELINEDVRSCDFFVLLLWDRWGTPPDNESNSYSSGTEEEYHVALECRSSSQHPLTELVVLFKSVDPKRLSDPGPQLLRVLGFKKQLESEKSILFSTFDEAAAFEQKLRCHLADWVRKHENGALSVVTSQPQSNTNRRDSSPSRLPPSSPHLRTAERLLKQGKRTEAELVFARIAARAFDPEALYRYGKFLLDDERVSDAEQAFIQVASAAVGDRWTSFANHEIGLIWRERNVLGKAEEYFRRSLEMASKLDDEPLLARNLQALGSLEYYRHHPVRARRLYREALEIATRNHDDEVVARIKHNLALLSKRPETALRLFAEALALAESQGFSDLVPLILCNIALTHAELADEAQAINAVRRALAMADSCSQRQLADTHGKAGVIYSQFGRWRKARNEFETAIMIACRIGYDGAAERYEASLRALSAKGRRANDIEKQPASETVRSSGEASKPRTDLTFPRFPTSSRAFG